MFWLWSKVRTPFHPCARPWWNLHHPCVAKSPRACMNTKRSCWMKIELSLRPSLFFLFHDLVLSCWNCIHFTHFTQSTMVSSVVYSVYSCIQIDLETCPAPRLINITLKSCDVEQLSKRDVTSEVQAVPRLNPKAPSRQWKWIRMDPAYSGATPCYILKHSETLIVFWCLVDIVDLSFLRLWFNLSVTSLTL